MSFPPQASSPPPSAQDLYDEYHRRTQGGETLDFGALCARHPEHETELRRLHAREQQRARMRAFGGLDRFEEPDPRATAILSELRSRGATIDRYRRIELLGEGGMGKVYEAEDTLLGRRVALKVISDRTRTEELLPLFDREMRIAAKLNHPGVGQVLDAGVDGTGRALFAMTLVRGTDLSKCLELVRREEDGWSITRVVGVLRQVADTMSYVHSCRILHRDLKPANIRVGDFGEVFVMDWGVAKAVGEADPSMGGSGASGAGSGTLSGTTVKGTPQYTSPELIRGEVETLGVAADVYSLGAILYEVLAGYAPYTTPGEKTSSERVLTRMSAGPVNPLSKVANAQPRELVDICEKAMAARGSSRYRDMAELSADLRAYLEGRPVPSIEGGPWVELRKWVLRNKPLAAALAGGLLVLVLGIVYSTMKTREAVAANVQLSAETKRANEKTVEAERKTRDVLSLSAIQELQDLMDEADRLWPAHPDNLPAYEAWLAKARVLIEGRAGDEARGVSPKPSLEDHEAKLRELEARALPLSREDLWWREQLSNLVRDLRAFTDATTGGLYSAGTSDAHGWGVVRRAEFARTIKKRSVSGPEAQQRWSEALASIRASPRYGNLVMTKQMGLLPIGEDPVSHLWEFADLTTGDEPERGGNGQVKRDARGRIELKDTTGLVFVLIPGGAFTLGAQATDQLGLNFDQSASINEAPYTVQLDAYFISKYEMTQGQWERFVGHNPSYYGPQNYRLYWNRAGRGWSALHPVEQVSWNDSTEVLRRLGLTLPTEAQWEFACRGSSRTVYWSGDDPQTLMDVGNVADQWAKSHGGILWSVTHEAWDDGNTTTAEVGEYRPNPFGLHDMHGNVWEWCKDVFGTTVEFSSGDGERQVPRAEFRVRRGGSFINRSDSARSAHRDFDMPKAIGNQVGLRPARALTP